MRREETKRKELRARGGGTFCWELPLAIFLKRRFKWNSLLVGHRVGVGRYVCDSVFSAPSLSVNNENDTRGYDRGSVERVP